MPTPTTARGLLAALSLLAAAGPAAAQYKLKIADAKIGLPPGRFVGERDDNQQASHVLKANTWAPIYLTLEVAKEYQGPAYAVIETADTDDLRTTISFPLGSFTPDQQPGTIVRPVEMSFVPLVRPTDMSGEVKITVSSDPNGNRPLADTKTVRLSTSRQPNTYVVLSLGSKLPGFELPGEDNRGGGSGRGPLRNGRVETAALTNVREMPDQWFGYAAADVVVLATGSAQPDFLDDLFDRQKSVPFRERREALLEWVRRGGKLIVSVGANAGLLVGQEAFQELLPARLRANEPSRGLKELALDWEIPGQPQRATLLPKGETFPVARLVADPGRPPRVLIPRPDRPKVGRGGDDLPVVVQAPYGMGRVTVVAFDLDRSPFLDQKEKAGFWDWLLRSAGADRASVGGGNSGGLNVGGWNGGSYVDQTEDTFNLRLREHVDNFEGVPVISFGWVALFIVLYTILIGPVEYLFLKKVVGRLELTWVTFPLIVLSVSAAAYFTAYAIKGSDLKLNKVDVVDVDPASGRVYGRTWFTIFSPRIDSYTIGVEPREGWVVAAPAGQPAPRTLVDWMAGNRSGGGNLVSRGYKYHTSEDGREVADGLEGVPIQVWSTKAFTANWSGYLDPGTPLVENGLYHPIADPNELAGSFVNRLPVKELTEAVLVYAGQVHKLGTLTPGQRVPWVPGKPETTWFADAAQINALGQGNQYPGFGPQNQQPAAKVPLWGALFHERALPRDRLLMNASLRDLDQSWRVSDRPETAFRDQAILLARVSTPATAMAEPTMTDADGPSPTKLWYKGLPGTGAVRQPVPGTLRQDTYIRVYLPVAPRPPAAGK